ncbi:MAG: uracil-DNA glycosylase, partial [Gammaproteobacteria bacterium]
NATSKFNLNCTRCPRIATNLAEIKRIYPNYHAKPVPSFGDKSPYLLVVGLGPGLHGANATGRPFTGDYAGILLYKMLYEFGYSNKPDSISTDDGLILNNCRITNAVKCLPPGNKPLTNEVINCNSYLNAEIDSLKYKLLILALGTVAHAAVIRAMGLKQKDFKFSHNTVHAIGGELTLLDSYHCSRYNTSTKRLTEKMFRDVFQTASKLQHG